MLTSSIKESAVRKVVMGYCSGRNVEEIKKSIKRSSPIEEQKWIEEQWSLILRFLNSYDKIAIKERYSKRQSFYNTISRR